MEGSRAYTTALVVALKAAIVSACTAATGSTLAQFLQKNVHACKHLQILLSAYTCARAP